MKALLLRSSTSPPAAPNPNNPSSYRGGEEEPEKPLSDGERLSAGGLLGRGGEVGGRVSARSLGEYERSSWVQAPVVVGGGCNSRVQDEEEFLVAGSSSAEHASLLSAGASHRGPVSMSDFGGGYPAAATAAALGGSAAALAACFWIDTGVASRNFYFVVCNYETTNIFVS